MKSAKPPVTLEDLLRIKRAEQPPAEFWTQFDQQMRAKQLAAIVAPRPWWAPLIRFGSRVSHLQIPVGAAAILAVSFITIREYRAPVLRPVYENQVAAETATPQAESDVASAGTYVPSASLAEETPSDLQADGFERGITYSAVDLAGVRAEISPNVNPVLAEREPTPSEKYIAANLAAAQEADPRLMDDVFGSSMRSLPARLPIRDPLTHVSAPGESRRSRLLAIALPATGSADDMLAGKTERVSRTLTEERMYDSISRVGLKGDRVAIKF